MIGASQNHETAIDLFLLSVTIPPRGVEQDALSQPSALQRSDYEVKFGQIAAHGQVVPSLWHSFSLPLNWG